MRMCFLSDGGLVLLLLLSLSALVDLQRALGVSAEFAAEDGEGSV